METEREDSANQEARQVTIEHANADGVGPGGKLTLDEDVVATIAGLAARDVKGIHSLGKSRLISFGDNPTRGVDAEVGKIEAAFDLDVIIDYGIDIREMAKILRQKIGEEVNKMAGRRVVEINVNVVGIQLPDEESPKPTSRVH
jgi:uncharacterized alkaline shock family protein YloU